MSRTGGILHAKQCDFRYNTENDTLGTFFKHKRGYFLGSVPSNGHLLIPIFNTDESRTISDTAKTIILIFIQGKNGENIDKCYLSWEKAERILTNAIKR